MDATQLLVVGLLITCLNRTGAQLGVCYGMNGNNLPSPKEVVDLYKSQNITRMRIYYPNQATILALRDSNIELLLGVPDSDLQGIASSNSTAINWVKSNVLAYFPSVRFRYICVGNIISPDSSNAQFVLPAMQNIHNTIASAGLQNQIKVSTSIISGLLGTSYPPSQGAFRDDVRSFIDPIITFLADNGAPLLANLYPYFSYSSNPEAISLSYALFSSQSVMVQDGKLGYHNLFDALVDAIYSALEKVGGSTVEIVVSETGWPSAGGTGASTENARAYNSNLIQHVKGGTPKRPGKAIETYVFAMFDENQKITNLELEQHWGLFFPNKQPKYAINFSADPTNSPSTESNKPYCLNYYIIMHLPSPL
ncbi:glucan endo-1,3-beta-glucosidase-like [Macadamia integrifolia]|uniref:glucan endo-1,3-beta-glucosidase-like n=1 Tax=Macadamia integrifolia TaxID=60698 RepID=UPI001C4FAFD8|nr:glucan endo-1,3-beta-glucosidase-like [Macadamia integrifolia]